MEETEIKNQKLTNQEIDYFKIARILLSRWYWILGTLLLSFIFGQFYLFYTPKVYSTAGTLKLEDKKSQVTELLQFGNNDRTYYKIQSETVVLESTPLLTRAIAHLDYRVSYYIKGRIFNRTIDLYPQKPFKVDIIKFDSLSYYNGMYTLEPIDKEKFNLSYTESGKTNKKTYNYNTPIALGSTLVKIGVPAAFSANTVYLFNFNTTNDFLDKIRNGLSIGELTKNSNILSIQETSDNPFFAAHIINAIMKEYLLYDRQQKMLSASQMIDFIDDQLKVLSNEVFNGQNAIQRYKENKKFLDLGNNANFMITKATAIENELSLLKLDQLAINKLKIEIENEKENLALSFNSGGVSDSQLSYYINGLNTKINERNALLRTYTVNAKPIIEINKEIIELKNNALRSLNSSSALITDKINYINNDLNPINEKINTLPAEERDLITLKREFEISEKVFTILSEKKIDAQIGRAGILPGATLIDQAMVNTDPVSPDVQSVRKFSLFIGLGIGVLLIILIRLLNPFIYDKETIESLTNIPIIGVIRKYPGKIDEFSTQILAISRPKSLFAESIRAVRANINFLASEKNSKVICITSEVAGEGKSFVAVNLASTLALINKRVILISTDLRRSKLHKTFKVSNDIGLSNYLANQCSIHDIINTSQNNLDFITSGPVPPNPAELIQSDRMIKLIEELKLTYDFIMVDTAPVGLVADALPIIRVSDINIFVIRSGKSKYHAATIPKRLALEYNLDNTVIILNAFAEDILHSTYYNSKTTGNYNGNSKYYYYSDYSGYEKSSYYSDDEENSKKWWKINTWYK
jgi:capsular exopolysaccharide synthesis family protein